MREPGLVVQGQGVWRTQAQRTANPVNKSSSGKHERSQGLLHRDTASGVSDWWN